MVKRAAAGATVGNWVQHQGCLFTASADVVTSGHWPGSFRTIFSCCAKMAASIFGALAPRCAADLAAFKRCQDGLTQGKQIPSHPCS